MTDLSDRLEMPAIPVSTYRLQLNKQFTFADAAGLVPYLRLLGISHCYTSPFLKARPGSSHGYDIVDHNELNPEIGSREDFEQFANRLHHNRMGLIADIVPSHMAVMGSDNTWWLDVLENGQASLYASFFDIDWNPIKRTLQDKLLIPVLGAQYGEILEKQELKLVFDAGQGEFSIYYFQHRLPVDPQTYPFILSSQQEQLLNYFDPEDPVLSEFRTIDNSFSKLPLRTESTEDKMEERKRDKEVFKIQLARLCENSLPIFQYIASRVAEINRIPGERGQLHALLERQVYRLAYWRVAGDEINYRRFFDINELAGLRVEDERVFEATHQLILSMIAKGEIQGLRIDHADGLFDPPGYYQRLNQAIADILNAGGDPVEVPPFYIVAEKIVANYEYLSSDWPIQGTTGYEFANIVSGVFIDSRSEAPLTRCYGRFMRERLDFDELVYQAKKYVLSVMLASELNVLANRLNKISEAGSKTRDYTLNALREALREVIACFPVYRTYINSQFVSKKDSQYINWAIEHGKQRSRAADKTIFEFIRNILLLKLDTPATMTELLKFVMKLQQYTAPVTAKGYEDTALYQYHRLISLNEVGGDPRHFGNSVNAFHYFNQGRVRKWPHTMLCLSTHDTKHSADVRARINVLTEVPALWREAVNRWRRLNVSRKTGASQTRIARNDEYLFYQVLVGTWPLMPLNDSDMAEYRMRIRNYMIKAVREAKIYTSWINQNDDYEECIRRFVDRCLDINSSPLFLKDFSDFEKQIRPAGLYNALAQTLLQLMTPGVPDVYQGNECWQFSLVDPDNRRPVDFNRHQQLLAEMDALLAQPDCDRAIFLSSLLENMEDGRIKLFLVMQTLRFRHLFAALFGNGDYIKINAHGTGADHLLAFARKDQTTLAIVIVPRLMFGFLNNAQTTPSEDVWADTWLELEPSAPESYLELFSQCFVSAEKRDDQRVLFAHAVFKLFPFAVLSASL